MKILAIAACDPRGVMGRNGQLPWHCQEDLKHFSDTIADAPLIMGRRTLLSLPPHYLNRRISIVFSRFGKNCKTPSQGSIFIVSSFVEFFEVIRSRYCRLIENFYVIGGAQIYDLFLQENLIEELILTKFKILYEGNTFFPLFLLNSWSEFKIRETPTFTIHRYIRANKSV